MLAGAAFSIKEQVDFRLLGATVPLSVLILIVGAFVWVAFYLMDRFWYHQFLLGSVNHGSFIEKRYRSALPELGLATAISKSSPTPAIGAWKLRSSVKIDLFYGAGFILFAIAAAAAACISVRVKPTTPTTTAQEVTIQPTTMQPNTIQPTVATMP